MHRIFLPHDILNSQNPIATGEYFHQLTRVLRVRPGMRLLAVCGDGFEYTLEVGPIDRNRASFRVCEKKPVNREISLKLTVYQGILKGNGMEEILPALVQLGASRIVPMKTARSVAGSGESQRERLDKIIRRATALSGRTVLMEVGNSSAPGECITHAKDNSVNLFFWEDEETIPLKSTLEAIPDKNPGSIGIFIGPEGGFTPDEVELAREAGFITASLGKRILEAKTAPIAATSAVLHHYCQL